ncbi:hypothetical protein HGH93_12195 [Chitinophaga polysaccharea]|uniref:hypothetical protein n=1 Tax=Chitinophaga polysaccharea TaxID=1293035 RepID=UPI001455000A|nr:hypothetical protein [Chitinophaga polysaccharea]NLR58868.1 hypothetical protein [Chitinophaga polysaccharea]
MDKPKFVHFVHRSVLFSNHFLTDANKDFILSLGAHGHIDYKSGSLKEATADIDMVLDFLGAESVLQSLDVMQPGGILPAALSFLRQWLHRWPG